MYSYAIHISPQLLHQLLTYFVNTHCCQTNYSAAFLHWTVSVKCTKYSLQKACFRFFFITGRKERERERGGECVCVCVCIALDEVNNKGMKWGEIKIELMHLHFSTHTHTWKPPRPRPPARYHATSSRRLKRSITLEREVVGVGVGWGGYRQLHLLPAARLCRKSPICWLLQGAWGLKVGLGCVESPICWLP